MNCHKLSIEMDKINAETADLHPLAGIRSNGSDLRNSHCWHAVQRWHNIKLGLDTELGNHQRDAEAGGADEVVVVMKEL